MPLLDPSDCVLLVIDTQPGFYRDRADVDQEAFASFMDRVGWVVAVAAGVGIPVVETVERPERNGDTAPAVRDVLPEDRARFEKDAFGAVGNDDLRNHLASIGRTTAVLVGMETDVCVSHSAIGLLDRRWRVAAVSDALFSPGKAHDHGLERLRHVGVELVSAKGLFYEWLPSVSAVREFKGANPSLRKPPGFLL